MDGMIYWIDIITSDAQGVITERKTQHLQWTDKAPTVRGFYFVVAKDGKEYLALVNHLPNGAEHLLFAYVGAKAEELGKFTNFMGPLPMPPVPVKEVTG